MNLSDLKYEKVLPIMRERMAMYSPNHERLDYAKLFDACRNRALWLWNARIVPELEIGQQRKFERALADVGMRAGLSIPWVFASGFAFGAACHAVAGGDPAHRDEAAQLCGLYMFILGTFDHLLDEYPDEFAGLGEIINSDTLERCVLYRDWQSFKCGPDKVLASGLLELYKVYFKLGHRLLDRHPDPALARTWLSALRELHRVEAESVDRRMSKVTPSKELIMRAEAPSTAAFWGLGVTACLGDGESAARRVETFAKDYGRLTWFADDASDIEKDIKDEIWSGLAIKLTLEAKNNSDVERVIRGTGDEAGKIITNLYENCSSSYWSPGDNFSLADILWAYIWAWVGGQHQALAPARSDQHVHQSEQRSHV